MISNILMAGIEQAANIMVVDSLFGGELKKGYRKEIRIDIAADFGIGHFQYVSVDRIVDVLSICHYDCRCEADLPWKHKYLYSVLHYRIFDGKCH